MTSATEELVLSRTPGTKEYSETVHYVGTGIRYLFKLVIGLPFMLIVTTAMYIWLLATLPFRAMLADSVDEMVHDMKEMFIDIPLGMWKDFVVDA